MAQEVCRDIGSGGGHYYKAGGFIPMDLLIDSYNVYCKEKDVTPRFQYSSDDTHKRPSDSAIKSFLEERIFDYLNDTKIIYGEDFDTSGFKKWIIKTPDTDGIYHCKGYTACGLLHGSEDS